MVDERKSIIFNIALKIVLIFIIITVNYLVSKYINFIDKEIVDAISAGSNGPTSIYISSRNIYIEALRYSLLVIFLINIIILLTYDVISLKILKKYEKKYKFKVILIIDLFIVSSAIIQIFFNLLSPFISTLLNSILISILLIRIYFIKNKK